MSQSNYALRLQTSIKREAERLAKAEGTTLNQFINVAVAEKVAALRTADYFPRGYGVPIFRALSRCSTTWAATNRHARATNFREARLQERLGRRARLALCCRVPIVLSADCVAPAAGGEAWIFATALSARSATRPS
jgi:hypothetical protein